MFVELSAEYMKINLRDNVRWSCLCVGEILEGAWCGVGAKIKSLIFKSLL
jgi:hypothetical protein